MKMNTMDVPYTRKEFERNMNLFIEQLRQGKLHFPHDCDFIDEISKVRKLPNGRVNLLTISEQVRLEANMTANMSKVIEESPDLLKKSK